MSEVSMSWWLSQSVQAELDSQTCDLRNRETLADLSRRLSQHCPISRTTSRAACRMRRCPKGRRNGVLSEKRPFWPSRAVGLVVRLRL
jgi:hypothetical protein